MDKKKHNDSVTVTVKLACGIVAAAEYSVSFSDQSGCQERQQPLVILVILTQVKIM